MKTASRLFPQGDVMFRRIDKLPASAVEEKRKPGQAIVVAHSETGHDHTIAAGDVRFYNEPKSSLIAYLQLGDSDCDVVHHRPFDVHETLRLLGGAGAVYEVRRQREWTPEGWRRVAD